LQDGKNNGGVRGKTQLEKKKKTSLEKGRDENVVVHAILLEKRG